MRETLARLHVAAGPQRHRAGGVQKMDLQERQGVPRGGRTLGLAGRERAGGTAQRREPRERVAAEPPGAGVQCSCNACEMLLRLHLPTRKPRLRGYRAHVADPTPAPAPSFPTGLATPYTPDPPQEARPRSGPSRPLWGLGLLLTMAVTSEQLETRNLTAQGSEQVAPVAVWLLAVATECSVQ